MGPPREAILYTSSDDGVATCGLCAHRCRIAPGRRGVCRVRENRGGVLFSLSYGRVVSENLDPVEKKPLYHFLPGSLSFSIATAGCNLACAHCQNYAISLEAARQDPLPGRPRRPEEIVAAALGSGAASISYTYTEPTVFMEFALDCAAQARERGLANVFVTNGFMTPEAASLAARAIDAANVDLKGASEEHYRKVCRAALAPVLETITGLVRAGVWVEVTTLLIPGLNDDTASLRFITRFLADLDPLIPWHVSRFFPVYRMTDRPPTPVESLVRARDIGAEAGLRHIYLGNVHLGPEVTSCHACGRHLIIREGYSIRVAGLGEDGTCQGCRAPFVGRFTAPEGGWGKREGKL